MEQNLWLDLLIRGASLGILLLLLARFLYQKPIRFLEISFILLILSILFYVFVSAPVQLIANDATWRTIAYFPVLGPFFLWWAGLAFFDDEFKAKLWHLLPAALVLAPVVLINIFPQIELVRTITIFSLYGHLVFELLKNRPTDLVEVRRQFRHWFILLSVIFGGAMEVIEVSSVEHRIPDQGFPYQAVAVFLLSIAFAFWSLRIGGENWSKNAGSLRKPAVVTPKDTRLLARLKSAMDEGVWQEEKLSVGGLARRLDAPEHSLRRAINQGLGYRNFSTFVNERRIAEACLLLSDPDKAQMPVLSIAYAVGFSSIGPFNRAFRSFKKESPTQFRANALIEID